MAGNQNPQNGAPQSVLRRVMSLPAIISLVMAALFLVFMVTRFDVDLSATWDRVKNANLWYLALAFIVHYTTFIFRGARWRLLFRNTDGPVVHNPGVQ